MTTDDPQELTSPEISALLDIRTWAIGTLQQIERVSHTWADLNSLERRDRLERAGVDPDEDPEGGRLWELLQNDVHFLAIAANHLVEARRQPLGVDLPRLSRRIERAVETLRTIREHYLEHRGAHYGEAPRSRRAAAKARALRALDEDAHPWMIHGQVYSDGPPSDITIAGVLPLDQLSDETTAMHDAADALLLRIAQQQDRDGD